MRRYTRKEMERLLSLLHIKSTAEYDSAWNAAYTAEREARKALERAHIAYDNARMWRRVVQSASDKAK